MTRMRKVRNAIGAVLMACGDVAFFILRIVFFVGPNSRPSGHRSWPTDSTPSYNPHSEHMKQAQKVRQYEEDRRRRNEWEVRTFGHTKS